jgi:HAD superfamily hydrolase (TIGR01549 family)
MTLQGVILDVDGTLVSSNDAQAQAWVEAFAEHGYEISFQQVRPLIGMGGDLMMPQLVPDLTDKAELGKQIAERRQELMLHKFGADLTPTSGVRDLLQKLHDDGLQLIIASSATEPEVDALLNVAQVTDLVSDYTTSDDAEISKPAPDLVEAALNKAHLSPAQTVMLGDTPYDIAAAERAGVGVIAFRTGGFSDQQLQGALAIYDDPADLLHHYQTSPLASPNLDAESLSGSSTQAAVKTAEVAAETVAETVGETTQAAAQATAATASQTWQTWQTNADNFLAQARSTTSSFLRQNRRLLTLVSWLLLALLGARVLLAVVDTLDDLPLVTPILKLVGLVYIFQFTRRYLIRQQNRQELMQLLKQTKADFLGR